MIKTNFTPFNNQTLTANRSVIISNSTPEIFSQVSASASPTPHHLQSHDMRSAVHTHATPKTRPYRPPHLQNPPKLKRPSRLNNYSDIMTSEDTDNEYDKAENEGNQKVKTTLGVRLRTRRLNQKAKANRKKILSQASPQRSNKTDEMSKHYRDNLSCIERTGYTKSQAATLKRNLKFLNTKIEEALSPNPEISTPALKLLRDAFINIEEKKPQHIPFIQSKLNSHGIFCDFTIPFQKSYTQSN